VFFEHVLRRRKRTLAKTEQPDESCADRLRGTTADLLRDDRLGQMPEGRVALDGTQFAGADRLDECGHDSIARLEMRDELRAGRT